jgi:hypothetical protein
VAGDAAARRSPGADRCPATHDTFGRRKPVGGQTGPPAGDAAVEEIIAAVASSGGDEGLMDLAADLAAALVNLIEQVAAAEDRAAVDVADELFHD